MEGGLFVDNKPALPGLIKEEPGVYSTDIDDIADDACDVAYMKDGRIATPCSNNIKQEITCTECEPGFIKEEPKISCSDCSDVDNNEVDVHDDNDVKDERIIDLHEGFDYPIEIKEEPPCNDFYTSIVKNEPATLSTDTNYTEIGDPLHVKTETACDCQDVNGTALATSSFSQETDCNLCSGNKVYDTKGAIKELLEGNKVDLLRSSSDKNEDAIFQCNDCEKSFKRKSHLKRHTLVHSGVLPHVCEICKLSFREKGSLKIHMLIHTGEKPFECEICKTSFRHKFSLTKHLLVHSLEKPHLCEICQKSFRERGHLKKHMMIHTGERPHICEICKSSFRGKSDLRRHALTHSGITIHKCRICKTKFDSKTDLKTHMLTHDDSEQIQFVCDVCKSSFSEKGSLSRHMLIHSGDKDHTCEICKKSFRHKWTLTKHMLIHNGLKPHVCQICKKAFRESGNLKSHMLIHTGEKPHACEICKASFREKGSLNRHMKVHTTGVLIPQYFPS